MECPYVKMHSFLDHPKGYTYVSISYVKKQLKLIHHYGKDKISLKDIQKIHQLEEKAFVITFGNKSYKGIVDKQLFAVKLLLTKFLEGIFLPSKKGSQCQF